MKITRLFYTLTLLALVSLLSACSEEHVFTTADTQAGSGGGAVVTTTITSLEVTITLKDGASSTANDITAISPGNPGYLTFKVVDQNGNAAPDQIVTVDTSLASINQTSFLTDSSGVATALLEFNNQVGADTLVATVTLDGSEYSSSKNYAVSATGTVATSSLSISLELMDPDGADVTVISADKPGTLTLTLVDENGDPVANQIVTVSTSLAKVVPTTVLTDANGKAIVTLDYQSALGADQILVSSLLGGTTYSESMNYAVVAPSIQMGDASGGAANFVSGQLDINISSLDSDGTSLSSSGSASISAYLVDEDNQPFTTPLEVTFSTVCASLSEPLSSIDQKVTTSSGVATATYQASGCIGEDTITANVSFGGSEFSATGKLTVASDEAGSINFVSATPSEITLAGGATVAGLQETSELRFEVVDTSGLPLKNQSVTFSVSGSAGGITFSPVTAVSNADGEVFTVVQAGSIPTVVNIIATVDSTGISTQSTGLVISAGLPDYDSFSIGANILNPEAADYNGEEVVVTVNLGDIYNNPPPQGTPVYFTAEGGSIGGTCSTDKDGRCSVLWISGNPRPADNRVTILAYTQGVESFTDFNGNGMFSNGDSISLDLGEVFRDDNENSSYDNGEFFADFNESGAMDAAPDGQYNGNLCDADQGVANGCSSQTTLNISRSLVLTMSASHPKVSITSGGVLLADETQNYINELDLTTDDPKTVTVTFSDINGQPLPVELDSTFIGTSVRVNNSSFASLSGTTSYVQQSTNVAGTSSFDFSLKGGTSPDNGLVSIIVTTPNQQKTEISFRVNR